MSRAVTADHVLFDECIASFRRENENIPIFGKGKSISYLITGFELTQQWKLKQCVIHPSIKVILPGAYSSFISKVENPDWVGTHNAHLYGIALAAIVSFITQKVCKSTRDDYLCRREKLTEDDLHQLALINPILTAGPGCTHTALSLEKHKIIEKELVNLIEKLNSVEYSIYRTAMQSIRLSHLSLCNKRDDFGLAYLLIVSAIEAVAQKAIKRGKVKEKHPSEEMWAKKAENDEEFSELLSMYKQSRGKQEYLKERYIAFISKYAPPEKWEKYVQHPMQEIAEYVKEVAPSHETDHFVRKNWFEKYPNELRSKEINTILADSYTHRSCFVHRGEQPPHTDPSPAFNRFFQEIREYKDMNIVERLLPNYELLFGIAKFSVINWLETK